MIRMGREWWRRWAIVAIVLVLWQIIVKPLIGQEPDPILVIMAAVAVVLSFDRAREDKEDGFD